MSIRAMECFLKAAFHADTANPETDSRWKISNEQDSGIVVAQDTHGRVFKLEITQVAGPT